MKGSEETEIQVEKDGTALLPAAFLGGLRIRPGSKVRVRVTSRSVDRRLLSRGVTEEEIEAIGALQFEQWASVVSSLSNEGALSGGRVFLWRTKRRGLCCESQ
jgi:hypothetical protein